MTTILNKNDFVLHEIEGDYRMNFVPMKWHDLSDFHAEALTWVGNALRQKESQYFWCDGAYCWYTDDQQNHEQCVWQTANGILMFEDLTDGKLYRVEFRRLQHT